MMAENMKVKTIYTNALLLLVFFFGVEAFLVLAIKIKKDFFCLIHLVTKQLLNNLRL